MATAEIYDYVSQAAPDYNVYFTLENFKPVKEEITLNQFVHHGDDDSEEVVTIGTGPIAFLSIGWDGLFPADAGTVFDWYMDSSKANARERSFPFVHPEDGHTYVVRFDMALSRNVNPLAEQHALPDIRLKVLGRLTSIVESTIYKWTQSVANGNEYHVELLAGGDPGLTEPTKVFFNQTIGTEGTMGSLAVEGWDYGDNDTLGYDTVYVRLTGNVDPDTKANRWIEIG